MGKINVLSSKIYNRISAGEVVERPFSVVKELVENSIDAGATEITVEITDGGLTSVKVTDNGSGIERDDLRKALLPHATSKISKISDLDDISSLGFRGEALASIAAVSKLKIVSRTKEAELGGEIYAEGGEIERETDCGAVQGTSVTVDNLFYNTPAREKFLRSSRAETGEISSLMARLILSNANIAFKYYADGKLVLSSFGDGVESAMVQVYGHEILDDCFYIDTAKNGIIIKGYISKRHFTKGNRSYQSVFVNGRYVINQTVNAAVNNAYAPYMMKHQYPFFVLSLQLPSGIVDVNVHPNKLDVRFSNNQIIYGSVYSVVSKVLDGIGEAVSIVVPERSGKTGDGGVSVANVAGEKETQKLNKVDENVSAKTGAMPDGKTAKGESYKFDYLFLSDSDLQKDGKAGGDKSVDVFAENKAYLESLSKKKEGVFASKSVFDETNRTSVQSELNINKGLNYVGQALNTYMFFDDGKDIYIVDQHAAHERIMFDKINEQYSKGTPDVQPLLVPFILSVNYAEYGFLSEKAEIINRMGIEIAEFGANAFKVSAVPVYLSEINLKDFFDDLLGDLSELKKTDMVDLLKEKLARKACRAAIKAGHVINEYDVQIIKQAVENDPGLKCPHGRPAVIKISASEVEKWFKRTV